MNQSGWPRENLFPVPQYKWREAEDRASKNAQLLSLTEQHVAALQKWATKFIMARTTPMPEKKLEELIGPPFTERSW